MRDFFVILERRAGSLGATAVAVTALASAAAVPAHAPIGAQSSGLSTFVVLLRGVRVGTETVDVARTDSGWLISATGPLRAPFDLVTTKFEMSYGADWQPRQLVDRRAARAASSSRSPRPSA